ncbi:hypothetical protein VSX64_01805 [Aurantimonas sp. C2-6-R+9]|uniref:Uncharacterized protein n=2 Tax=root TaxID=1 RepID=A0A9C9NIY1_9HYPH|nr:MULTISPECIES: hypothetical protein [unclassified Aurantimonas]MEC5289661.1 hypothetical protein [Aurantimonas sp. C2-3-R2]MEC5379624.1 hypothetical protein [Aurantimonas sp. C2-6-R+9]MEC5410741.1 hypothetical protein [Aurantimonas sp. C2-4-R8]HDZ72679.1 hypothetical protein [Aurantimonas coralicida]HEU02324.1 hypothetical protein [Aurantimonas coralicida]
MTSEKILTLAEAWWRDIEATAAAYPSIAIMGLILALLSLLLSRSLFVFIAAAFLAVAAILVTEPVADPLKREVLIGGFFLAIVLVSVVVMMLRLRLRQARIDLRRTAAEANEWQALYQDEVRWRQAGGDVRDRLPPGG